MIPAGLKMSETPVQVAIYAPKSLLCIGILGQDYLLDYLYGFHRYSTIYLERENMVDFLRNLSTCANEAYWLEHKSIEDREKILSQSGENSALVRVSEVIDCGGEDFAW